MSKKWTSEEDQVLIDKYETRYGITHELVKELPGRSRNAISSRAKALKLTTTTGQGLHQREKSTQNVVEGKKQCSGECGQWKPLDDFGRNPKYFTGRRSQCKRCERKVALCSKHKLTPKEHDSLFSKHNGRCSICGSRNRIAIDHCHSTGKIRGLLCINCNTALGTFRDCIEGLQEAITYLERTG